MPNTKTITGSGLRGYSIELSLSETSTSIENNTSTISYTLKIKSGNYSYADYGTGYSVYINGTRVAYLADNGMDTSLSANSSLTLKTGTTTVAHNNDGTKTVSISASVSIPEGSYGPGDMSCSGTWALTTIPRASTLTVPTLTVESSSTLTVTAADNSFTHKITYSFSGLSGTIATLNAGVSTTSWTPPNTFYAKMPNSTQGTVTITLKTLSGATEIGSNSYEATVKVGTSIKPTAPTVTLAPVNTNAWINSQGLYVGGYSKVKVTSSATAGTGATMSSYTISGSISGSGTPYTSDVLSSGTKTIKVTATDSRGRTNNTTTTVTFLSYSYPGFSTFKATRGTYAGGSWTSNVNGDHIRIQAVPSVSLSANGNTGTVTVKIGASNPDATSGNYYYFTSTTSTSSYTVTGSITDSVGNTSTRTLTVPTVEVPFNINVDLPGAAFGMIAQNASKLGTAPSWSVVANGKNNVFAYMPYTWVTRGGDTSTLGYARIATITITSGYVRGPIEFRVARREDPTPSYLYVRFATGSSADPTLSGFYIKQGRAYNSQISAFMVKTGTSVWDVYLEKVEASDSITVSTNIPEYIQGRLSVTYADALLTSVPPGATMATAVPCSEPSLTVTKVSGSSTVSTSALHRDGNVCSLNIQVSTSASISDGTSIFVGDSDAPRPVALSSSAHYLSPSVIIASINSSGRITLTNTGGTLASGSSVNCTITYLTND